MHAILIVYDSQSKFINNQVTHFLHITNITSHTSNSCYYRLQNPLQNNLFHQFYLYCLATSSIRMTIYINKETQNLFYNKKKWFDRFSFSSSLNFYAKCSTYLTLFMTQIFFRVLHFRNNCSCIEKSNFQDDVYDAKIQLLTQKCILFAYLTFILLIHYVFYHNQIIVCFCYCFVFYFKIN